MRVESVSVFPLSARHPPGPPIPKDCIMKIDSIEIFHLALPLRQPRQTPAGQIESLQTVLACVHGAEATGWGEASPGNAPLMGAEWAAGVFGCVKDWLAPAVTGQVVDSGQDLQERLAPFRGNQYAKGALDAAWWDLQARLAGQPLHQLLKGTQEAIEVGLSFDRMESIDLLLEALAKTFEAGYSRVELKVRPGWDVNMLNFVRQEFPTQTIHVDVEGDLRLDHMEVICRFDDFALAMVEQPLPADDLVGHAMIQETIRTPVCLDESIATPEQADMALELHSGEFINVKPGRVGGLTPAIAIHDACQQGNIPCFVGGMPQTAIGARTGMALAAKQNFTYPADYFPWEELFPEDVAEAPAPIRDDTDAVMRVPLWSEAGIGVEPNPELLDKFCLNRAKTG